MKKRPSWLTILQHQRELARAHHGEFLRSIFSRHCIDCSEIARLIFLASVPLLLLL